MNEIKEIWTTIEDHPKYQISNLGRIRSKFTGLILKLSISSTGTKYVVLNGDQITKTYKAPSFSKHGKRKSYMCIRNRYKQFRINVTRLTEEYFPKINDYEK